MMIGLCSAMSYSAQPPTPSKRIQYGPAELVAYSPPHTLIPEKEKLLARLPADTKKKLSASVDSSDEIAIKMKEFCDKNPKYAQQIASSVVTKLSKSTSALESTPDEPA